MPKPPTIPKPPTLIVQTRINLVHNGLRSQWIAIWTGKKAA